MNEDWNTPPIQTILRGHETTCGKVASKKAKFGADQQWIYPDERMVVWHTVEFWIGVQPTSKQY
eukprot:4992486-Alexandrium_andersonii.AAC.1